MTKRNSTRDDLAGFGAEELGEELQQPLTAACNYIGAARLLLNSPDAAAHAPAIENLAKAEIQILRAGDMVRRFQRATVKRATIN